jgi:ABC-type sugar transport system substrate-binding protein
VKQAGRTGQVKVIGLGLPNENKRYVHEGVTDAVILWNTGDLGWLTVQAGVALAENKLKPGVREFAAGGRAFAIEGDNLLLGRPFVFTRANIDQFDF